MTKPSKKKAAKRSNAASRKRAAPKPVAVVETAPGSEKPVTTPTQDPSAVPAETIETSPEAEVGELKQEIAKFDHDGDGHIGGSKPHGEETAEGDAAEQPAEAPAETVEDAPAPPVADEAEQPVAEGQAPSPVAPFERCSLGPVECRIGRVPLSAVLGLLSPDGLRRIEAEKSTASFESTRQRLLATDGRATPVVFEKAADEAMKPSILHGYAELAAAEDLGVNDVSVILVPAGGASEAQSYIVEMVRQQRAKEQTSDDDELFYRVHAEG